jgi:hypothetical protein
MGCSLLKKRVMFLSVYLLRESIENGAFPDLVRLGSQYLPYIEEGMGMDQFCGMHVENFEVEADMVCAQPINPLPPNPFQNTSIFMGSRQSSNGGAGRNVSSIPGHSRRF